jgi:ferric-dicitrate binding protein FerR (iron transport regulator)
MKPLNPNDGKDVKTFTGWVVAYLDGALPESDVKLLEATLETSAEWRRLYNEICLDVTLAFELLQDRDDLARPLHLDADQPARIQHRLRISLQLLGAAAVLFLIIGGYTYWQTPPSKPILAQVTFQRQAHWSGPAAAVYVNQALSGGRYNLASGEIRFKMADDTVVSLAGPATFNLVDYNTLSLHSGTMAAHVTEPNRQFTVQTDSTNVIDLGTAFGVHVNPRGESIVAVFDGSVRLEQGPPFMYESRQQLDRGDAARVDGNGSIQRIDLDPEMFIELWPLTAGIDEVSDLVSFIPPVDIQPIGQYRSNTRLYLLPEKQNVKLQENLEIDFKLPLKLPVQECKPCMKIKRGCRISSYLLFFNSEEPKSWDNMQILEGSVRFAKPILGIIINDERLARTDSLLGLPDTIYPDQYGRGLKLEGKTRSTNDKIDLSEDQRTLTFRLYTGPNMDSLRILVCAD